MPGERSAFEINAEIAEIEKELKDPEALSYEKKKRLEEELAELEESREGAVEAIREEHAVTEQICDKLVPLAGVTF